MKRFLALTLILGVATFGLAGCGETSSVKEVEKGPGGTTTTEKKVTSTGENPPPNSAGETGASGAPPK